ncbi:hypothetical protein SeLEV6574_g03656 [Synchytrium endobioticum]|uniref:Uncharacterized protein n=1 Tax=Synchytrium endobioticum TaxID=286115 RepID=A0A507D3A5_9FUNG|nr:hypothetical protein SeLEV6574_g03656 [Synchytrium endobioticum]
MRGARPSGSHIDAVGGTLQPVQDTDTRVDPLAQREHTEWHVATSMTDSASVGTRRPFSIAGPSARRREYYGNAFAFSFGSSGGHAQNTNSH